MPSRHKQTTPRYLKDWFIPAQFNFWFQTGSLLMLFGVIMGVFGYRNLAALPMLGSLYSIGFGVLILGCTLFGKETVATYRHVRHHIACHGNFDSRLQRKLSTKKYCVRAGARAAAVQAGKQIHHPSISSKYRIW